MARTNDLVIDDLGTETLVYDTQMHHIHYLHARGRAVWRLCDGHRSIPELDRPAER
jgi:hypothetical protein